MKKLLVIFAAVCMSLSAFAGNPVKATTGGAAVKALMKDSAGIVLECDWSQTQFDNRVPLKEQMGEDYEFIVKDCEAKFAEGFNAKSKGLKMTADTTAAKYRLVLTVKNVDCRIQVGFVARWESKMWGSFKIVGTEDGATIAEGVIEEAEDGTDFVKKECFGKTFLLVGEYFTKIK